jgi:4'-phosphopantetheinyl transferase
MGARVAARAPRRPAFCYDPGVSDPDRDRPTVELWWTSVRGRAPRSGELVRLLADDERRRADTFRVADARQRFVAARAMLRSLLGQRLGVSAQQLVLVAGPTGKPTLPSSVTALGFNVAHSADIAVVAIATSELGVDVEALRPVPRAERLADRFFAQSERQWLHGLPRDQLDWSFLALWTCKEACLKALGTGIGAGLARVEVDPERLAVLAAPEDPNGPSRWTLLRAELPVPAVCTVAIRGDGWRLAVREFDWNSIELNVES